MLHTSVSAADGTVYVPSGARNNSRHRQTVAVHSPAKRDEKNLTLVLNKVKLYQQAVRQIAPLCSGSEFTVFSQILDRSVGYGHDNCFGTALDIAEGRGKWNGCGKSERTVKRAIAALVEKGIIVANGIRNRGTTFTLHIEWQGAEPMLATPKRLKDAAEGSAERPKLATPKRDKTSLIAGSKRGKMALEKETGHTLTTFEHEETGSPACRPDDRESVPAVKVSRDENGKSLARENLQAIADMAAEKTAKARAANVERQKHKGNAHAFEVVWLNAVAMHFPEVVAVPKWTIVQRGIIMSIAKKWTDQGKLHDFSAFLEWCVVSWPAVMRQQFKWMTKQRPPAAPDFRFWAKFHEEFLNCYHSGKLSKWMRAADRDRVEFLKARGMTHEQALYEVAKEQALKETREETHKVLAAAKAVEKRTKEEAKRIERMQEFSGNVPLHPKSQRALEQAGVQPVAPIDLNSQVNLDSLDVSDIPAWEE